MEQEKNAEDFDPADLITQPFEGWTGLVQWLSVRWWGVLGPPALLAALLLYWLPRAARAAGAPQRARAFREAGLLALGWAGVDLGLTAGLPLLQLSYAPVRSAFLYLFCGRAAVAGTGTALALASVLAGPDLTPGGRRRINTMLWALHAAMAALVVYATYIDGQHLEVTCDELDFPGRTPGAPPARLRIAHLTDIHVDRLTRRDRAMVADLREAQPDLICLTGDFLNIDYYDAPAYTALYELMRMLVALQPRYGVYACLGNNDPSDATRAVLRRAGVRVLDQNAVVVPVEGRRVQILGARTSMAGDWQADVPRFREAVRAAEQEGSADLRLLLYHMPDLAPQAANAGIDLYLCGHTHGGQVRLPLIGALRTASRFGQRYVMGLNRLPNGGYIYTSRGVGFEGLGFPRVRVLCPPQVALFDVTIGA